MAWLKRYFVYTFYFVYTLLSLTSLLLLFVARNVFINNQFIDEEVAVGIAKNYCDLPNLE